VVSNAAEDEDHDHAAAVGLGGQGAKRVRPPRRQLRLWVHIYLHMQADGFDLVPKLIGRGGGNLRKIAEATAAKIRIRGKGSGHLEGATHEEAQIPLMIAVTSDSHERDGFKAAISRTLAEVRAIEEKYKLFCQTHGLEKNDVGFTVGPIREGAQILAGEALEEVGLAGLWSSLGDRRAQR
jgi:hypothetical protein